MPWFPLPWNPSCPSPRSSQFLSLVPKYLETNFTPSPTPPSGYTQKDLRAIPYPVTVTTSSKEKELNRYKEQNPYLTKTRPDINTQNPNPNKARFPDCSTKPQAVPVRTIMSALDPSNPTLAGPENDSTDDKQHKDLKAAYGYSQIENEDTP